MIFDSVTVDPFQVVQTGGVVALLLLILIGGNRGWWVFGWQYQAMLKEAEEWKEIGLTLLRSNEQLAGLPPSTPPVPSTSTGGPVP